MVKNNVKLIFHTHVSNKRVIENSHVACQCYIFFKRWGLVLPQLIISLLCKNKENPPTQCLTIVILLYSK